MQKPQASVPTAASGLPIPLALQCALAALAAEGYRPSRQRHHYTAIESLALTLKQPSTRVRILDGARKKRNMSVYEIAGSVSDKEVEELLILAKELHASLVAWIEENHNNLVP